MFVFLCATNDLCSSKQSSTERVHMPLLIIICGERTRIASFSCVVIRHIHFDRTCSSKRQKIYRRLEIVAFRNAIRGFIAHSLTRVLHRQHQFVPQAKSLSTFRFSANKLSHRITGALNIKWSALEPQSSKISDGIDSPRMTIDYGNLTKHILWGRAARAVTSSSVQKVP